MRTKRAIRSNVLHFPDKTALAVVVIMKVIDGLHTTHPVPRSTSELHQVGLWQQFSDKKRRRLYYVRIL